jgi:hypothetical protein
MTKSVNTGNAEKGAVLAGNGAMPATAHLVYERHERADRGGQGNDGTIAGTVQTGVGPVPLLTSETENQLIAQPDGNRSTAR